jgi:rhodanese-related sulfurtransferase
MAAKAVVVVDTRDPDSFAAGHIPGALSLPDHELAAETPAAARVIARLKASTQPVVVYCACPAEATSLRYVRVLRDRGVRDVRALTGGWVDWFNAGRRVETSH